MWTQVSRDEILFHDHIELFKYSYCNAYVFGRYSLLYRDFKIENDSIYVMALVLRCYK